MWQKWTDTGVANAPYLVSLQSINASKWQKRLEWISIRISMRFANRPMHIRHWLDPNELVQSAHSCNANISKIYFAAKSMPLFHIFFLLVPVHYDDTTHSNALHSCSHPHIFSSRTCCTYGAVYVEHIACMSIAVHFVGLSRDVVSIKFVVGFVFFFRFSATTASACHVTTVFIYSPGNIMATKIINRSKFVGYVKCCVN